MTPKAPKLPRRIPQRLLAKPRQRRFSKGWAMIFAAEMRQKLPQNAQGLPGHGGFGPAFSGQAVIFRGTTLA
jgi:hypothetical protein